MKCRSLQHQIFIFLEYGTVELMSENVALSTDGESFNKMADSVCLASDV